MDVRKLLTWCEINRSTLTANAKFLKELLPKTCHLAPVVKANGYGHGLEIAASAFIDGGATWLCVETVDDGFQLRRAGITVPIYIIGSIPTDEEEIRAATDAGLRLTIASVYDYEVVNRALHQGVFMAHAPVHVKYDTGFGHGLDRHDASSLIMRMRWENVSGMFLEGVVTHYSDANDNLEVTRIQAEMHLRFCHMLEDVFGRELIRHCTNSASILRGMLEFENLARAGIAAYGIWESKELRRSLGRLNHGQNIMSLNHALTWKARITSMRRVPPGTTIGYGSSYITAKETVIATIPIGYSDGLPRRLSNVGVVSVKHNGETLFGCIVGRVCMNMAFLDVTNIVQAVGVGTPVTIVGCDPGTRPEDVAVTCETIPQEIVTRIAGHIPRVEV